MAAIKGITVAVGEWYARTLEICLAANMRHLTECLVVTAPGDPAVEVAARVPGVRTYETMDFYAHGARFNKGLCIEKGFDVLGCDGFVAIFDSDCIWPDSMPFHLLSPNKLHGMRRRILEDPDRWHPGLDWSKCPLAADGNAPIGYAQIFHADDPRVATVRPWYDVSFPHAGGGDARFLEHWPTTHRAMLPIECLHLGKPDLNWMGTDPESRDLMAKYVTENGWTRAVKNFDPAAARRAGPLPGRVEVPGYPVSDYELPFERRARADRARRGRG